MGRRGWPVIDHRIPCTWVFTLAILSTLLIYRTWSIPFIAVHGPVYVFRARREEGALTATFGQEWQEYCRRVPAIIPGWRRRKLVEGEERHPRQG